MTQAMTEGRDYLAYQIKVAHIPLSDRQKEAVRLYLTRNPEVSPVLNPFTRVLPEERERILRRSLRKCVSDGVVAQAANPADQHLYQNYDDDRLINTLYAQVVGLDVLETLLGDDDVSSITVINQNTILYEKHGQTYIHPSGFESQERMIEVIKNLAIRGGQQLTPASPTADLAFPPPHVVRIHLSIDPVTPRFGGFMALRRGRAVAWTLEKLTALGVMDDMVADFMRALMKIPASIIVGGEPASGKTTLLEVMISLLDGQHICVLEQAAELNPTNRLLSFFEVPPTSETISLATLTIDSLRKNAQVVIIGETRGAETGWLLFIAGAMKAIMTTLHGRNSRQVVDRLATNAQIQGDPPSPFIGNKELAKQAVANAFDFVVHCTQLPNGRRVISGIDHISGVEGETIQMENVVKAVVDVDPGHGGGKKLRVHWEWNPDWQSDDDRRGWKLPDDMDFHLRMAEVRAEVVNEESGASTRLHQKYQRACLALDQGQFNLSTRLFAELLQNAPSGFQDAEVRLRRSLQGQGNWEQLLKKARAYEQGMNRLVRRRQWTELATALRNLDVNVELRTALSSPGVTELKKYEQVLAQGQGWEQDWNVSRRRAAIFVQRGQPDKAATLLRKINLGGLNDDLRHEVRRLRLESLQSWREQAGISADQSLQINHEMFALADDTIEPGMLADLAKTIRELEEKMGRRAAINIDQMNVSAFTHINSEPKNEAGVEQQQHILYLSGVLAMQENMWDEALVCFRDIAGYRQADVFIKSLEALKKGANSGTVAEKSAAN